MFSQAGTIPVTDSGSPSSAIAPQRGHDRCTAGHVGLLADDVRLRLQEVAARVEGDGLPDQGQPRCLRGAGRFVAEHEQQRLGGAAPADRGERAESGLDGVDGLGGNTRKRGRSLCEPGGRDHVRRRVDELAGDVDPARDERRALGYGRQLLAAPADHEALDAARLLTAAPAPSVVAADDGPFGQRAHLVLEGEGEGRVERPRDRPAAVARAHRPRRSGPQAVDAGLERDDSERGRRGEHGRDRIGLRDRALRGTQLHRPRSRRDGDEIGPDGRRLACT
jgi:hypothetical protein